MQRIVEVWKKFLFKSQIFQITLTWSKLGFKLPLIVILLLVLAHKQVEIVLFLFSLCMIMYIFSFELNTSTEVNGNLVFLSKQDSAS